MLQVLLSLMALSGAAPADGAARSGDDPRDAVHRRLERADAPLAATAPAPTRSAQSRELAERMRRLAAAPPREEPVVREFD